MEASFIYFRIIIYLFLKSVHQCVWKSIEVIEAVTKRSVYLISPSVDIESEMPLRSRG